METKVTSPALKGLIISLILIVLGLGTYFANLDKVKGMSVVPFVLLAAGIIWACISYAKQLNGNVTFGNTFAHGFKTTAAVTAIFAVYSFIALKFIMPEMVDAGIEEARKKMMEQKNMSVDQMEQSLAMARKFFIPFGIAAIVVIYLIMGCLFSLVGAAVAKKNPNYNPLQNQ